MTDAITVAELLRYDPETGLLTWRVKTGRKAAGQAAGYRRKGGNYVVVGIAGKTYLAHRVAYLLMTGEWPAEDIDHANGDRQDNRWANLRPCSRVENMQNLSARRLVGQHRAHNGKFRAQIRHAGKKYHLGYFDSQEEASQAYREAKHKVHAFAPLVREN